jgi:uncharacterized membrane protein (UPF0127 family)
LVVAGCAPAGSPITGAPTVATAATTTSTTGDPTTTEPDTGDLSGFELASVILEGRSLRVAVADTDALRMRGLMGVDDLGTLAGMLFVWPEPVEADFWMKDTVIPLDLAFIAADGEVLAVLPMEPCLQDPCPTYGIELAAPLALEVPARSIPELVPGARLLFP